MSKIQEFNLVTWKAEVMKNWDKCEYCGRYMPKMTEEFRNSEGTKKFCKRLCKLNYIKQLQQRNQNEIENIDL